MQNKEQVYFLTVHQAKDIASRHETEPDWDIWKDEEAQCWGWRNWATNKARELRGVVESWKSMSIVGRAS